MPDSRVARLALVALQVAAAWACAAASGSRVWLALGLVGVSALFLELPPLPPWLARLAPRFVLGLVGLLAAVGLAWVLYLPVADTLAAWLPAVARPVLAGLGALLLLARRSVPVARGALPASLGGLLGAAFVSSAELQLPFALAGLAGFVLLAEGAPPRHRLPRLLLVAVPALGVSLGLWRLLPWAQPFVEAAVADVTNPIPSGMTGFEGPARMGEFESLPTSPLLRLYAARPAKLRGQVLTRFDGRLWTESPGPRPALVALRGPLPGSLRGWSASLPGPTLLRPGLAADELAAGDVLAGSVVPIVPGRQLLVPFGLLALQVTSEAPALGPGGTVAGRGQPDQYGFVARPEAGLDDSPCEECLTLPEKLDPRFRDLADELAAGNPAPAERVRRTLRHLDERCRYSLKPGLTRPDALAEFLFEKRQGLCAHFASAAALLLRLQGVPTRYVRGFQVGDLQRAGDHFLLRGSDRHAWIDARLPEGWRELDPTPADDYAAAQAANGPGWLARAWEALASRAARLKARLASLEPRVLLAVLVDLWPLAAALAGAGLALRWWRRRRRARPAPPAGPLPLRPELRALVQRVDRGCARAGAPRPAGHGLVEHLDRLPASAGSPAWRAAAREAVEAVYAEAYGGRALPAERLQELRERL